MKTENLIIREIDLGNVNDCFYEESYAECFKEVAYVDDRKHFIIKANVPCYIIDEAYYNEHMKKYYYEVHFKTSALQFLEDSFVTIEKELLESALF